MENDVDMWEMAKKCGKWLKYLTELESQSPCLATDYF